MIRQLTEIIANFQDWRCRVLDDGIAMYSHQFFGDTHDKLKGNFKSAFNSFSEGDKTIIVCCFNTYSDIVIFQPSSQENSKFEAAAAS